MKDTYSGIYMETKIDFRPRTLGLRKFKLKDCHNFFLLIGTDKALRRLNVMTILKKNDTEKSDYELDDILLEDLTSYDQDSFNNYIQRVENKYGKLDASYG